MRIIAPMSGHGPEDRAGAPTTPGPRRRTFVLRYVLLQLPDLVVLGSILLLLHRLLGMSYTVVALIVVLWVVKCVAFYPLAHRVYSQTPVSRNPAVGSFGIVRGRLDPTGYAAFSGELWRCVVRRGARQVEKGATVRVVCADDLTLVVEETEPEP